MVHHCYAHIYVRTYPLHTNIQYMHVHTPMQTGNTLTSTKDHASSQKQQTAVSCHDCLLAATCSSRSNQQFSFPKRVFSFCSVQESICFAINCLIQASIFFHILWWSFTSCPSIYTFHCRQGVPLSHTAEKA